MGHIEIGKIHLVFVLATMGEYRASPVVGRLTPRLPVNIVTRGAQAHRAASDRLVQPHAY